MHALVLHADPLLWYKMFTSSDQNRIGAIGFVTCFFLIVVLLKFCSQESWISPPFMGGWHCENG